MFEATVTQNQVSSILLVTFHGVKAGWVQDGLLRSDAHHDSPHSREEVEREHLEAAKERNAWILDAGDLFDVMQSPGDRRRSYGDLKPEYKQADYLDEVISDTSDFYAPYAENLLLLGMGNHEGAIIKFSASNPTRRLAELLNLKVKPQIPVFAGPMNGAIRFQFDSTDGVRRNPINLYYHHGYGGAASSTRGITQANAQGVYLPDYDVVVNGHNHNSYLTQIARVRVGRNGKQYRDLQHHVRTPGYKDEWRDPGAWGTQNGHGPRPVGAVWMRMIATSTGVRLEFTQDVRA